MQETWVQSLGQEDLLENKMATHPVFLPGKIQWWRSLVGDSHWGREGSDTTEQLHFLWALKSCRIIKSLDLLSTFSLWQLLSLERFSISFSNYDALGKALSGISLPIAYRGSNRGAASPVVPPAVQPFPLLSFPPHTLFPSTHHSLRHSLHLLLPSLASSPTIIVPAELARSSRFSSPPGLFHKDIRKCSGPLLSEVLLLF